jgi:hypothetical protein
MIFFTICLLKTNLLTPNSRNQAFAHANGPQKLLFMGKETNYLIFWERLFLFFFETALRKNLEAFFSLELQLHSKQSPNHR